MFAPVYDCPKCGDVWQVEMVEHFCGDDDVIVQAHCRRCLSFVREKFHVEENGERVPVWHALTEEEAEFESLFSEE